MTEKERAVEQDRSHENHDHDLGLPADLARLSRFQARRRALAMLGAAGVLTACGDISPFGSAEADVTATGPDGALCVAHPGETAGPFPADGSNQAHGTLANVLDDSGIVRTDMRTDVGAALGAPAEGAALDLTLKLVDVGAACAPLEGYAVYLWHCDAEGRYSLYEARDRTYLRAVGVSDGNGSVRFRSIVPGCYRGRYPHLHFEVYPSLAQATSYRNRVLTSQIAVPRDVCEACYSRSEYGQSVAALADVSIKRDGIFGNNTETQIAAQTISMSGDAESGFTGEVTIGVRV